MQRSTHKPGAGKQLSRPAAANQPKQLSPEEVAAQDHARTEVARTLRVNYTLRVKEHFTPPLGDDPALHVTCRLSSPNADRALVYAVLEEQGWNVSHKLLQYHRDHVDTLRLVHADSAAKLCVIIRIPTGEHLSHEAHA